MNAALVLSAVPFVKTMTNLAAPLVILITFSIICLILKNIVTLACVKLGTRKRVRNATLVGITNSIMKKRVFVTVLMGTTS